MTNTWMTKRFPFGYKLFISYLLLVMIPVVVIGAFSYVYLVKSAREQTRTNLDNTLEQTLDNVINRMNDFQRISNHIFWEHRLQDLLVTPLDPYGSYYATETFLIPHLTSALRLTDRFAEVSVYFNNEQIPEVYSHAVSMPATFLDKRFAIYHMDRIAGASWIDSLPVNNVTSVWKQVESDVESGQISLLRNLIHFQSMSKEGLIRVTANLDELFQSIEGWENVPGSYLLVLDEAGNIVYPVDSALRPAEWPLTGMDYFTIEKDIPGVNWQLKALIPLDQLEKKAKEMRALTIWVCIASFLVLAVFSWMIARHLSKRVMKLVSSLQSFTSGEFTKRIYYKGNDEFADIAAAFNEMANNIDGLIGKVYLSEMRKKEAELEMLQAQINPHFLYNTLSSISQLAKLGKTDRLVEMVAGLAKFYRISLNEGKTFISVEQELKQIEAYIGIKKIKHMDTLNVSYTIDNRVLECETVKLILQPFVENALEHAWVGESLNIRIVAEPEQGNIVFKVIDDGLGMSKETVDQLLQPEAAPLGYGIRNVDERIKLHYGPLFGVGIASRLGMGTAIRMVIPMKSYKGG